MGDKKIEECTNLRIFQASEFVKLWVNIGTLVKDLLKMVSKPYKAIISLLINL